MTIRGLFTIQSMLIPQWFRSQQFSRLLKCCGLLSRSALTQRQSLRFLPPEKLNKDHGDVFFVQCPQNKVPYLTTRDFKMVYRGRALVSHWNIVWSVRGSQDYSYCEILTTLEHTMSFFYVVKKNATAKRIPLSYLMRYP